MDVINLKILKFSNLVIALSLVFLLLFMTGCNDQAYFSTKKFDDKGDTTVAYCFQPESLAAVTNPENKLGVIEKGRSDGLSSQELEKRLIDEVNYGILNIVEIITWRVKDPHRFLNAGELSRYRIYYQKEDGLGNNLRIFKLTGDKKLPDEFGTGSNLLDIQNIESRWDDYSLIYILKK